MIRMALWILAAALLAGVVHILTVLLLPEVATRTSFARLAPIAEVNRVTLLRQPSPDEAPLPFMDPAFAVAVCRYDLSGGVLRLNAPIAPSYTSATFYTPKGIAYYAINDRAAVQRAIQLELMTEAQRARVQQGEEETAADRLIVESPTTTGMIVLRALAPEPSMLPIVRGILAAARCAIEARS